MRTCLFWGTVLFLSFCIVIQSQAQPIVNIDENGHGNLVGGGPLPATVAPDPTNGIPTLEYTLPFTPSVPGDVQVFESPTGGPFSDVLRFIPGTNQLFVYSDPAESGETADLADNGIPANVITPTAGQVESGVEGGVQGLFPYTPTPQSAAA